MPFLQEWQFPRRPVISQPPVGRVAGGGNAVPSSLHDVLPRHSAAEPVGGST